LWLKILLKKYSITNDDLPIFQLFVEYNTILDDFHYNTDKGNGFSNIIAEKIWWEKVRYIFFTKVLEHLGQAPVACSS